MLTHYCLIFFVSNTFQKVHEQQKFHWAELQADFLEEYSVKSIFPIHFQPLVLVACFVHCLSRNAFFFVRSFTFKGFDAMFVRGKNQIYFSKTTKVLILYKYRQSCLVVHKHHQ
jgi:hypothetical protein